MKIAVIFLALAVCVSANPLIQFAKTVAAYQQGTLKLQGFQTQACDTTSALADLSKQTDILTCVLTLPGTGAYPTCAQPDQAAYAAYCPTCSANLVKAVKLIDSYGCNFAQIGAANVQCTKDSDCTDASAPHCSSMGNCGAACNATMGCMSCVDVCSNSVCTDMSNAGMMTLSNNVLGYELMTLCSKNSAGNYCSAIQNGMNMMPAPPTCADLGGVGCCAGLLVNTALDCNSPDAGTVAMLNAWKANCTSVDFTQTCGLPKSSVCCATGAKVCGFSAAFGVAPAIFTFLAVAIKFLF